MKYRNFSYRFCQRKQKYWISNGNIAVDFETGKIKLPKLKAVKARLHREYSGQIKSATVSQVSSGKYYVSILVETQDS